MDIDKNKELVHIILSPSQQKHNICKEGDTEKDHCRLIAKHIYSKLNQDPGLFVTIIPDFSEYEDYLKRACNYSNEIKAEIEKKFNIKRTIHFSIHTDAHNEKTAGTSVFYNSSNNFGKKLATNLFNEVSKISGVKRTLTARDGLMEIGKAVHATSVLTEYDFHDNPVTAKKIHNNLKNYADASCIALYQTLDMRTEPEKKYKTPEQICKECLNNTESWQKGKIYLNEHIHELPEELHVYKHIDLFALKLYYHDKNISL
jgi:hypothetical protein